MLSYLLLLATIQKPPVPTLDTVLTHIRRSFSYNRTIEAEYTLAKTWTDHYESAWGDNGPTEQVVSYERHRWVGNAPRFTDLLLTDDERDRDWPPSVQATAFDGKVGREMSFANGVIREEEGRGGQSITPDGFARYVGFRPTADFIEEGVFSVSGWVINPIHGRCLRIAGEVYEGRPVTIDLSPENDWLIVRVTERRAEVPILEERLVTRFTRVVGVLTCSEAVEREVIEKSNGTQVLLKQVKMFAKGFKSRPFDIEEFLQVPI